MNKVPLKIDFSKKDIDNDILQIEPVSPQFDVNRLQIILDTIPIPVYHKNANGEFTGCNMAFEKAMGISRERLIGKTIFDFADNDSAELIRSMEVNAVQSRTVRESEELLRYADGTLHTVIIRKAPFLNSDWQPGGVVGTIFDITEQKAAEDLLRKRIELDEIVTTVSTNFIQARTAEIDIVFKQSLLIIGEYLDAEHGYVYLYSKDRKSFRLEYSFAMVPVEEIEKIDPNFIQNFSWGFNKLRNFNVLKISLDDEIPDEALNIKELMHQRGIKSLITIPLVFGNELEGFLGFESHSKIIHWKSEDLVQIETIADIFINAIQRKLFEEALEAEKEELSVTLRSIGDGVITTDLLNRIVIVNKAAEGIIGWTQSDVAGMHLEELFKKLKTVELHSKNKIKFTGIFHELNNKEIEELNDHRVSILSKQSIKKTVSISGAKLSDQHSRIRGNVYVIRDITEILKIEKRLTLSQKMESVGQLAAGVAHEINTPMQYIGDNTHFLKEAINSISRYIDESRDLIKNSFEKNNYSNLVPELIKLESDLDIQYLVEEIPVAIHQTQTGIQHVNKIVLAMKDFAHPSAKEKSLVNINKGIEVTATISKNEWKYTSELELVLMPELPEIFCVMDEINQVVLNMIVNATDAIKDNFSSSGNVKGKIVIETGIEDKFVFIKISDNGSGIKEENHQRIFDPFFTTKEVGRGTGQGLSIAHDIIVNKHCGKITFDSMPGKGTTFIIYLPITERAAN